MACVGFSPSKMQKCVYRICKLTESGDAEKDNQRKKNIRKLMKRLDNAKPYNRHTYIRHIRQDSGFEIFGNIDSCIQSNFRIDDNLAIWIPIPLVPPPGISGDDIHKELMGLISIFTSVFSDVDEDKEATMYIRFAGDKNRLLVTWLTREHGEYMIYAAEYNSPLRCYKCSNEIDDGEEFRCGGCKAAFYCSRDCFRADWKACHKTHCSREWL